MRIVIAPQGFKGTLSGLEAAEAMAEGVRRALPSAETVNMPLADGGHETLDVLITATRGQTFETRVTGPSGAPVLARWGALGGDVATAVVEMAQASGLTLVPESGRNPMLTTTYGTGELLKAAMDAGFRRIIVGVGGSGTNDGGAGAAQALGVRLLDALGHDVPSGAEGLLAVERIDLSRRDPRLDATALQVAVDVSNPLLGPDGASATYGPQKGATEDQVPLLDEALAHFAAVIERELGVDVRAVRGGGAAGGLAAGLLAMAGAKLVPGARLVCDAIGLEEMLEDAALVITGEGRVDWQTVFDKAPIEVARRAAARGIPVAAIGGSLGRGADEVLRHGVTLLEAATAGDAVPDAAQAHRLLADAAERVVRRALVNGLVRT